MSRVAHAKKRAKGGDFGRDSQREKEGDDSETGDVQDVASGLQVTVPVALDSVPLSTIRRYERLSFRFMDAYLWSLLPPP